MTIFRAKGAALAAFSLLALAAAAGPARAEGDPAAGKMVFRKCAACHTVQPGKNRVGPSLAGVFGRKPGTAAGFKYSSAMTAFGADGKVWDAATLDTYLTNPREVVKGTRMVFPGLRKAEDRANVIAYLKSVSGN